MLVGIMVASTFQPEMFKILKSIALPVVLSSLIVVAGGGVAAIFITRLNLLDAATAYIATSPGAMSSLIPPVHGTLLRLAPDSHQRPCCRWFKL